MKKFSPLFIFACIGIIFLADLQTPLGYVDWIAYVLPIILTIRSRSLRVTFIATGLSTSFIIVGAVLSPSGGIQLELALLNRTLGILLGWAVAIVVVQKIHSDLEVFESENRYRSLFENMLEGYAYCKMLFDNDKPQDFVYIDVNNAFEKLTGLKNVVGKKVSEVIPGIRKSNPELFEIYGRVALTGKPERFETYVESLGVWLSIAVYSPGKEYFIAVFDNITERKKAEKQIGMLAHAVRSISECVSITDMEDKLLFLNEAFLKTYGYDEHELLGKHIGIVRSPNNLPEVVRDILPTTLRGGWQGELFNRRKDGSEFPIFLSTSVIRGGKGQPVALIGVATDITERKLAEETLKQSEENYRKFFEDDLTGDYISTPDGKILACNPAFTHIFGFASVGEVLSTNAVMLYPDPKERERFLYLLREKKKLEYYETKYARRDGSHVYGVENAIGIFDAEGNLLQIRGYLFDDTKRHTLERQFIQSQKLESLGTLAGGIAHDFNNILGIIMGHTSLLPESMQSGPAQFSESVDSILKATNRGASLVKQLLTFARKTDATFESLRINDLVEEIIKLLKETFPKAIHLTRILKPDLPSLDADATQMHQVLLNLCVNARDAMPKGGTLLIRTILVEGERVKERFPGAQAREHILVQVGDTGTGMDDATKQRIFEPFFTTKGVGKGTGLGLALVYSIVKSHNGFITVDSEQGKGTTFSIFLPVQERRVEEVSMLPPQEVSGGSETILLIDDEEMLRELVKTILVSKGYTVLTASDGEEGVAVFTRHREEIALVISDLGLPRMGGEEVYRQIRSIDPTAEVILASGFIDPAVKSELYKAGVRRFIQKPYLPSEVLQAIREILDAHDG